MTRYDCTVSSAVRTAAVIKSKSTCVAVPVLLQYKEKDRSHTASKLNYLTAAAHADMGFLSGPLAGLVVHTPRV